MENKFKKYWEVHKKEWHGNQLGIYHVSEIGCNHQHLNKNEHYGPCLLQAFYNRINPLERTIENQGNLLTGTQHHKIAQKNTMKNNRFVVSEFPLQTAIPLDDDDTFIVVRGSIDILKQKEILPFTENRKNIWRIWDFKTASEYTLAQSEEDDNPTYRDQSEIYAYILLSFILDKSYNTVEYTKIVQINKHNLATFEIKRPYNNTDAVLKWIDFVDRCMTFHYIIEEFLDSINIPALPEAYEEFVKWSSEKKYEICKGKNYKLPAREPMRWCKYCLYQQRCRDGVLFDEELCDKSEEELQKIYETETGNPPLTKKGTVRVDYTNWKKANGYEE